MPVKLFSAIFAPGTSEQDAFELEVNNWAKGHPDLVVIDLDINTTEKNGQLSVFLFFLYAFVPPSQRKRLQGFSDEY